MAAFGNMRRWDPKKGATGSLYKSSEGPGPHSGRVVILCGSAKRKAKGAATQEKMISPTLPSSTRGPCKNQSI